MRFLILGLLPWLALGAQADEPAIIAKARAYLGSESALAQVRSLHFVCRVIRSNPDFPGDLTKEIVSPADIFFEKPSRERIAIKGDKQFIETVIDGYDGWQRKTALGSPPGVQLAFIGPGLMENLQADAWENLYFYRGIETVGGTAEDRGLAAIDGIACEEVVFTHSPSIVYFRYFDQATGRLVYTRTAGGAEIREKGEIVVGGIRFPQSIVITQKNGEGKVETSTYRFDKIFVNEALADSLFTVPLGPAGDYPTQR